MPKKSNKEKKLYAIAIPVKAHLKQFLIKNYGENLELEFKSSSLSIELFGLLSKRLNHHQYRLNYEHYEASYTVYIGKNYFFHYGRNTLSGFQISLINKMIMGKFNDRFIEYVMALDEEGVTHREAIFRWCEKYNLDKGSTDWYQTLRRKITRHKEKFKKPCLKLSHEN